ncbi:MAG: class I SAM-dependent methyltransferase [Gilvibacter sp.]
MKLIDKLKQLARLDVHIDKVQRNTYDSLASQLLHRLFPDHTILPFSPFSLNPNTILHLVNDVQVNSRASVIEFGSGVSTLILAKFIKSNGLPTKITSIDHNPDWSAYIKKELIKHGCDEVVNLVVAPLAQQSNQDFEGLWYDPAILQTALTQKTFDVVLVDGPSGGTHVEARYLALPKIIDLLEDDFIVFLDDIRRPGEQQILAKWRRLFAKANITIELGRDARKVYATLKSEGGFSTNPMSY